VAFNTMLFGSPVEIKDTVKIRSVEMKHVKSAPQPLSTHGSSMSIISANKGRRTGMHTPTLMYY